MSVLESTRIDKPLRDLLRETFPDLFAPKQPSIPHPAPAVQQPLPEIVELLPIADGEERVKRPAEKDKKKVKKLRNASSLSAQTPESKRENILDVGLLENALSLIKDEFRKPIEELESAIQAKSDEGPEAMQRLIMCIFENVGHC